MVGRQIHFRRTFLSGISKHGHIWMEEIDRRLPPTWPKTSDLRKKKTTVKNMIRVTAWQQRIWRPSEEHQSNKWASVISSDMLHVHFWFLEQHIKQTQISHRFLAPCCALSPLHSCFCTCSLVPAFVFLGIGPTVALSCYLLGGCKISNFPFLVSRRDVIFLSTVTLSC